MTSHNAKLSDPEVRARIDVMLNHAQSLRDELKAYTCASIAELHGVSEEAIKQYKQGRTYSKTVLPSND